MNKIIINRGGIMQDKDIRWNIIEQITGDILPVRVKEFQYFKFSPVTFNKLKPYLKKLKKIEIPHGDPWEKFVDTYDIYEIKKANAYLVCIVEEYVALGTEEADCITDMWRFSRENWIGEKLVIRHWEDGIHSYIYYPEAKHFALYLLSKPKPPGSWRWDENEYQDYDYWMPQDYEFVK